MKYWPQWTRRVVIEGTGRDPLGLSRVSDSLTDFLLPCIITTTDRARYYSFYTWAITDIETQYGAAAHQIPFEEEFRRREAAFALASWLGKTKFPLVGKVKVSTVLGQTSPGEMINTDFTVLPSNPTGGFGQYYQGCLQNLGLVRRDEGPLSWVPTERGRPFAEAFAAASKKAPYMTGDWRNKVRVPHKVLRDSADLFSLDGIRRPAANEERSLLLKLFFNLGEQPSATMPLNRQATLGQFLSVLKAYEEAGIQVKRQDVDRAVVYWPHYYGSLYSETDRHLSYTSTSAFSKVHMFWQQFCIHQFFAFALEEFLAAVLEALARHPEGLARTELLDSLLDKGFGDDLRQSLGVKCDRPTAMFAALGISTIPDAVVSQSVAMKFGAKHPFNEWAVYESKKTAPQTHLGRALLLLAMLYGKWRGGAGGDVFHDMASEVDVKHELWIGTGFEWIDAWLREDLNWSSVCERLLDWLVLRHDQVKFQKRKLDASWLEFADGRYSKQQDIEPDFRSSRHHNAATIMYDLGLLEYDSDSETWSLTGEGKQLLNQVIRART
jgi:hypothetical protein